MRVVAARVIREGRALVSQRLPGGARPLEWEFPGGKVEPGEGDAAALVRECREELGVEIRVGQLLEELSFSYDDLELQLALYASDLAAGEPQPLQANELKWVRRAEASGLTFSAADQPLLRHLPP